MTANMYLPKPVLVEAMRVAEPFKAVAEWCHGRKCVGFGNRVVGVSVSGLICLDDKRRMGRDIAYRDEWIVKTTDGYFAMSDERFRAAYQVASFEIADASSTPTNPQES